MIQNNSIKTILNDMLELMKHSTAKKILSVEEVARYLGVSPSCIYKWTSQRIIPHSKVQNGKILFFDRQKITRWALQNEVPTYDHLKEQALKPIKRGK